MDKEIDNRVWGMMLVKYSQQAFLKNVNYTDEKTGEKKGMSGKELYLTLISLLELGALYVRELPDGCATIEPKIKGKPVENDITDRIDLEDLKDKYEECAWHQLQLDKEEKEENEV